MGLVGSGFFEIEKKCDVKKKMDEIRRWMKKEMEEEGVSKILGFYEGDKDD